MNNVNTGSRVGNLFLSDNNHQGFYDATLSGDIIYILSKYSSISQTMLMLFDTSTNTPGQSYIISANKLAFLDNESGS